MISTMWREIQYLLHHRWDLCLVTVVPCTLILMFSLMFAEGKPEHLPIAVIDQDQSQLSLEIRRHLELNHTVHIAQIAEDSLSVEKLLNQNKIWGYITIPAGAEQRFVQAQDAQISIAFNQSYFSLGNTISSAMLISTLQAMAEFTGQNYLKNNIPYIDAPTPNIKLSPLYNPGLNYEFYLEPYMIPAILHLLLCCCVAFAVGQELKFKTLQSWVQPHQISQALFGKIMVYVLIFCVWTWLWMFWLIVIRGWFVAGQLWLIVLGQFLFYSAYAFVSSVIVLATQDLSKSFGIIAVYGGSSLSFAGVTLPLNNAPLFTQFWSNIIPYTPYAKLQTEQWVVGSPLHTSMTPFLILAVYVLIYAVISKLLLKKRVLRGAV